MTESKLNKLMKKKTKYVIGLMSGTSADGIDAALVRIKESEKGIKIKLIAFDCLKYSPRIKNFILDCSQEDTATVKDICRLNFLMGELFAQAACHIVKKAKMKLENIDLIGSHGQTICHLPDKDKISGVEISSTLQVGEASIIAEKTGIVTVSDFRPRDMAAGGQGAPLSACVDFILYHSKQEGIIALNIGGIANVTAIPAKAKEEDILAFDTGPGNMLIDSLIKRVSGEKEVCDRNGVMAQQGEVVEEVLARLMEHPFLSKSPPKSTGREEFGEDYLNWIITMAKGINWKDLICTITAFTAKTIASACKDFIFPVAPFEKMVVSGGGVHNKCLMNMLHEELAQLQIVTSDELNIPADAREAISFAVLANETIMQRPGNLPSATGAQKKVVLGKITL
jgi:anhydro-N-acetylmuramic acid kinase